MAHFKNIFHSFLESTGGLFKAFDIMNTCHGEIFVNFGAPMSLFDYFETNRSSVYWNPNEPSAPILTKDRLQLIGLLAREGILSILGAIFCYFNNTK